jgi:transposase
MLIHLHKQATTTPKVRAAIQASGDAGTALAERFGVTAQTIYKWRKRDSEPDRVYRRRFSSYSAAIVTGIKLS